MAAPLTNDSGAARRRSDREHGADLAPVLAFLPCRTPEAWLEAAGAAANLPTLLVDHANCEKKAAATALNLMYRYVEHPALLHRLSRLAREELRHFEQVLAIIEARGIAYPQLSAARYASGLRAAGGYPGASAAGRYAAHGGADRGALLRALRRAAAACWMTNWRSSIAACCAPRRGTSRTTCSWHVTWCPALTSMRGSRRSGVVSGN
jgi:hypothetical protein